MGQACMCHRIVWLKICSCLQPLNRPPSSSGQCTARKRLKSKLWLQIRTPKSLANDPPPCDISAVQSTNLNPCSRFAKEKGFDVKPDGDKGYRRVVASPAPKQVLEARAIQVGLHPFDLSRDTLCMLSRKETTCFIDWTDFPSWCACRGVEELGRGSPDHRWLTKATLAPIKHCR